MEVGADEGQQRALTTDDQNIIVSAADPNPPAADQQAPSPGSQTVTNNVYQGEVSLEVIHNDLQHGIVMDYWILGALMMIAGMLVVITFFVARGESSG
ncbi:hypothetical protein [Saccharibacillus qingshengii]|uniref:hypothetical protein n=1 Tax=Saccharibacillus qingshengii TaxID=1763540 RepID=UPI001552EC21|nr:hypothetical protein [Saccharibacillus qingshengii]